MGTKIYVANELIGFTVHPEAQPGQKSSIFIISPLERSEKDSALQSRNSAGSTLLA
jgi:hypothetical protein